MPTAYETPTLPFAGSFGDLPNQWIEASTRAFSASAELYTTILASQADAARSVVDAYVGLSRQAGRAGAETAETAEQATTEVVRGTAQAAQRATRRTAGATRKAARRATKATAKAVAKPAPVEAPITGYDDLTAEDLVAKLPEQSQATLAQVAAYERSHERRSTVLDRVAALSGPEPAPGYDELTVEEVQKLLSGGDDALATAVRDYERRHKSRASVLEAAQRQANNA